MLIPIALSAVLMQQTPVPPGPPDGQGRVVFVGTDVPGGLDKDGDGQITREEFAAPINDRFARMDINSDGSLSTEELTSGHGGMGSGSEGASGRVVRVLDGDETASVRIVRVPDGHGPHGSAGMPRVEIRRVDGGEEGVRIGRLDSHTRVVVGAPGADVRREIVVQGSPAGAVSWTATPRVDGPTGRIELRRMDGPGGDHTIVLHGGPDGTASFIGALAEAEPSSRVEILRMGGPEGATTLDTDSDGKISEAEFSAPLREAFARMDADRSGFIEAGERGSGNSEVFVHRIETGPGGED